MLEYDNFILERLKEIQFKPQGAVGDIPSQWAKDMAINHDYKLPDEALTREEVHEICQNQDFPILKAYIIVMSWGAQGRGPSGKKHVQQAWSNQTNLEEHISIIKQGKLSREDELIYSPTKAKSLA